MHIFALQMRPPMMNPRTTRLNVTKQKHVIKATNFNGSTTKLLGIPWETPKSASPDQGGGAQEQAEIIKNTQQALCETPKTPFRTLFAKTPNRVSKAISHSRGAKLKGKRRIPKTMRTGRGERWRANTFAHTLTHSHTRTHTHTHPHTHPHTHTNS